MAVDRGSDQPIEIAIVGDVGRHEDGIVAEPRPELVGVGRNAVGEDHRRSIGGEDPGDRGPEVRRGPRDDRHLAVEVAHRSDPDALAPLVDRPSARGPRGPARDR